MVTPDLESLREAVHDLQISAREQRTLMNERCPRQEKQLQLQNQEIQEMDDRIKQVELMVPVINNIEKNLSAITTTVNSLKTKMDRQWWLYPLLTTVLTSGVVAIAMAVLKSSVENL